VQGDAAKTAEVATTIEKGASDLGADVVPTAARLAEFHRVENTYISTFQALGGLGLLVGTLGLGAVVLRNVLERRRELALLGAVGYAPAHVLIMVLSENLVLLGWGLVVGAASALVAIAPSFLDRAAGGPVTSSAALLVLAVFVSDPVVDHRHAGAADGRRRAASWRQLPPLLTCTARTFGHLGRRSRTSRHRPQSVQPLSPRYLTASPHAENWPQWRGPQNGVVAKPTPVRWSKTENIA
jgi:hypothetical protein